MGPERLQPGRRLGGGRRPRFPPAAIAAIVAGASLASMAAAAPELVSRRLPGLPTSVTAGSFTSFIDSARWPVSADGRFVVFATRAADVVSPALAPAPGADPTLQVYVRDLQSGTTALVSVNAAGSAPGNGSSGPVAISSDGRYVLFNSLAYDLVAGDQNNLSTDVYVRDLQLHTTELVSVNLNGTAGGSFGAVAMSPDARFILFTSAAGNLVSGDVNAHDDAFVRDRQTGSTTIASVGTAEEPADHDSQAVAMSSDGRYVTFDSRAQNLAGGDANNTWDVFRRDLQTGTTDLVSVASTGTGTGNGQSTAVAISPNGRYLLFESHATNLVTTADGNFDTDVFVRDLQTGLTELVSVNSQGTATGSGASWAKAISDDGRYVAFTSPGDLVAGDPGTGIFVRDLQSNTTTPVSGSGGPPDGGSNMWPGRMSGDGRFLLFDSGASNLVPGDFNDDEDTFLYDRQLSTTTLVSAALGGESGNRSSRGVAFTPDGRYVVLVSDATDLVDGADLNEGPDMFERDVLGATTALVSARADLPAPATGRAHALPDAVSADGSHVLFSSPAGDLVSGDANGLKDVYVRNLETVTTTLASVNVTGTDGGDDVSTGVGLSQDGRYVLFSSYAGDLVDPGIDGNFGVQDVYVRDLQAGTTSLVSVTPGGVSGDRTSAARAITPSGRHVLFVSAATDLAAPDVDGQDDVFVRDLQTGVTELVSVNLAGNGSGNGPSQAVAITPDGRFVLFVSSSTDLTSDLPRGFVQVYVRDRQAGTTALVSVNAAGTSGGTGTAGASAITADGRYVLFSSYAGDLVPGDGNGLNDVFVRDRQAGTTTLVSRNAAGTGPGNEQSGGPYGLSADGRYVLFGSAASDLVPNDANNQYDLFRRDLQTGSTVLVSVNGAGSASGNGHSLAASMSSDGQLIAFESLASDLVSGDVNGRRDTFVRDLATGTTTLMSTNPGGLPGNSDSFVCCIAANGARVVFSSRASDLTANDFNGTTDVFAVATPGLPFGNGFEDGTLTAWSAVAL